jgi:glycosyltransferase involved in cell wall biosynthesis
VQLERVCELAASSMFFISMLIIFIYRIPADIKLPILRLYTGRLDIPVLLPLYDRFAHTPVILISNAQREPLPWQLARNGLPRPAEKPVCPPSQAGDYLAFLGRICPEKRLDRAIKIAKRVGMKIEVAAKVDAADRDYYTT